MGILSRFIRQEVEGASPERIRQEEEMAMLAEQDRLMMQGGYTGGAPLPPMQPMSLPPSVDAETMKLYLKPKTPANKEALEGDDRFWIYDDDVCSTILSGNMDATSQRKFETIMRQAMDLQGCDNVDYLIMNLQREVYGLIITNKSRSDLPDHIRERLAQGVTQSFYGDANNMVKSIGERPKENRAIIGLFGNR